MHAEPLYLSHWDASVQIRVPTEIRKELVRNDVLCVRFLYECYARGQKGAILNCEPEMNLPLQISAFLHALRLFMLPALVVCPDSRLAAWRYHLAMHGKFDTVLLDQEPVGITDDHVVIVTYLKNINVKLQHIANQQFCVVVVDGIDTVATRPAIRWLKRQFTIGLTCMNFLKTSNYRLYYNILKFAGCDVGKFKEFQRKCEEDLVYRRNPYRNFWLRITWAFCKTFTKPTEAVIKRCSDSALEWYVAHYGSHEGVVETILKARKRKPTSRKNLQTNESLSPTPRKQPHKDNSSPVNCESETKAEHSTITIKHESETITFVNYQNDRKDNFFNASQETIHYEYDIKSDSDDEEKDDVLVKILNDKKSSDSEDDTLSWLINDDEKDQSDFSTTKANVQLDDDSNDILLSLL